MEQLALLKQYFWEAAHSSTVEERITQQDVLLTPNSAEQCLHCTLGLLGGMEDAAGRQST
jgi:hypothetical protein